MSGVFPRHPGLGGELDPGGEGRLLGFVSAGDHMSEEVTANGSGVSTSGFRNPVPDAISQRSSIHANSHFTLPSEDRETRNSRTRETVDFRSVLGTESEEVPPGVWPVVHSTYRQGGSNHMSLNPSPQVSSQGGGGGGGGVILQDSENLLRQAHEAYRIGNYPLALQNCQPSYVENPDRTEVLLLIGAIYYQMKNYEQCIAFNDRCILLDPTMAEAHANLANALQQMGNFDMAIIYYQVHIQQFLIF